MRSMATKGREAPPARNDSMRAGRGKGFAGARITFFACVAFLCMSAAVHAELAGAATVISGDTIEVQGRRLRLSGVTAPGLDQQCVSARASWRCGSVAKLKLAERIAAGTVICHEQGIDGHGRTLGRCRVDDAHATELNRWLVAAGWALASQNQDQGHEYMELEQRAMQIGAGLWREGFVPSDEWRRSAESARREPDDASLDCSSCTLRHRALGADRAEEKVRSVRE